MPEHFPFRKPSGKKGKYISRASHSTCGWVH